MLNLDQICWQWRELEREIRNLGKRLEWKNRDEAWWVEYVIDVTVLYSFSLRELGGTVQCFGEFGASGRAGTMKIGRCVRELHKMNW